MSSDVPVNSSSPDWKRPPKVITIKRRKKNGQPSKLTVPDGVLRTRNAGDASEDARMKSKRRNPFGCGSLPKRANVGTSGSVRTLSSDREEDNMTGPDVEGKLLAGLSQLDEEQKLQTPSLSADVHQKRPATSDDPLNGGPTIDAEPPKDSQAQVEEKEMPESLTQDGSRELPEDLSLKSRVRFTSPHPFSWCSRIKTTDEASGVCGFVRGQERHTLADPESWASSFQQCVMTWIHPNLPWLRLFPRIVSTSRKVDSKGPPATIIPNIQEALLSDWTNSFRSVFQLLKAQMCPYFYVCGHQFTVLFHGVQTGGAKSLGALLTPTSRGLREALDNEGVSFKMPLAARQTGQSGGSDPSRKLSTDGKQDDGASDACPEKSQRSKMKSIDHFPESLVQVSGGDTQALFNFLINSKSLVTQSGPLAGVPPTLLAPIAFEGATLRALKVKQGSIRQTIAGKLTQVNSLEVSGPLLPLHVQQLCSLFQHSQHGDFSAVFSTHEATATFNRLKDTDSLVEEGNSTMKEHHTEDIKELVCEKGLYKWT
ncbi:hypothetical protein Bbelb_003260 [Branchiostoma belcheri]|nr:hypothetical protein Bbelb_003260 [Branchiostoma belcheri]